MKETKKVPSYLLVYFSTFLICSNTLRTYSFAPSLESLSTTRTLQKSPTCGNSLFANNSSLEGIRLNKVFKATHSRREADKLIASGRVRVNGEEVKEKGGFKVVPYRDVVELDGVTVKGWEAMNAISRDSAVNKTSEKFRLSNKAEKCIRREFEYVKYWKPVGIICTTDPSVRNNIIDAINRSGFQPKHRIYPVGRLDKETSGLIILTSDGRLPNAVLRGERKQPKIYHVTVDQPILERDLRKLRDGIVITTVAQRDGKRAKPLTQRTKPCTVKRTGANSFEITLIEGRNRQIRKMAGALNYTVVALQRTDFMGIHLKNEGKKGLRGPGEWALLDEKEMTIVERALSNKALD